MSTGQRRRHFLLLGSAAWPVLALLGLFVLLVLVSSCADLIGLSDIDRVGGIDGSFVDVVSRFDATQDAKKTDSGHPRLPDGSNDGDTGAMPCSQDGQCTSAASPRCDLTSGMCVACLPTNDNCPSGTICMAVGASFACMAGCNTAADCVGSPVAEAGFGSVGEAGSVGDAGRVGEAGSEAGIEAGTPVLACCNNVCVDTSADTNNCGGCGMACSTSNVATVTCGAGVCNGMCSAGFDDCDHDKQTDGCETQINGADPMNCGGCGAMCSSVNIATPTCALGVCNGACNAGFEDCNNDKQMDGCESDPSTDPMNCGGCGTVCSTSHMATVTCGAGACNGSCAANYSDCNANKQTDGCEDETPAACTGGVGSNATSTWVVCSSSCAAAWLSSNVGGSGNLYDLLTICNSLGYSTVSPMYAGNCGDTCGTCQTGTSCTAPGTSSFTSIAYSGGAVGSTIEWECLR